MQSESTINFASVSFGLRQVQRKLRSPTTTEVAVYGNTGRDDEDSAARPRRLNEIVNGKRGVTTDTALRFAKALGTTSDVWLNMQRMVDLYEALHSPKAREIARIKPFVRKAVA